MSQRKRLALIDGHALAFRAFHAMKQSGLRSSRGEPTYAVFGFAQILLTMIQEQHPEYVAISFDVGRTFRDEMYSAYKAGRAETPEEFHPQMARIQELCRALNMPIYTADGFEADDVIGTLARQASAEDVETLILTGDTDALQLVDAHVQVILSNPYGQKMTTTIYDEEKVRERYKGLNPCQLTDLRGLKGDSSDNIPGVKGIGEAGAITLLNQFGTVENLYDHLGEVPQRYQKLLDGQREAAVFSKKLATIVCDAPVRLSLADAAVHDYDRAAVIRLFQELELGTRSGLLKKLPGTDGKTAQRTVSTPDDDVETARRAVFRAVLPDTDGETAQPAVSTSETTQLSLFGEVPLLVTDISHTPALGDYRAVTTDAELESLVRALDAAPGFAFDTETTGLRPLQSALCGISIAVAPGSAVYVPFGHAEGPQLPAAQVIAALKPFFENPDKATYAHNAKFDIEMLLGAEITVRGLAFDTMIVAALLGKRVGLKDLAFYELQLPHEMTSIEELIGKASKQITFDKVPVALATPYAAADADMTLRLVHALEPQLATNERLATLFRRLELPLVDVLVKMERAGIGLDKPYIEQLGVKFGARIGEIEHEIYQIAERPFNINSSDQLSDVLFGKIGLPTEGVSRTAKTKKYSITADTLERLRAADTSGICERILEYRQLSKLKSTYVDALPGLANPQTGRVHTTYNQVGAATGRLSCLPAGTLVNTQCGLVGIEEVRPDDFVRTAFGPQRVLVWEATGLKPVITLKLSNGISLRCSPEHRLRSLGRWVEASDLVVGDPLYMSHAPGMFGEEIALDLHYTSHYDTCKTTSLPNEWSVELAELIGYHMADGHVAHSNYNGKPARVSLAFGWEDDELIAYFADVIYRLFGKEPTQRITRSCPVLEISSVDIGGMIEQLGAGGKSGVIKVPPSIYRAPEPIVAGLLRGYFEGDGSVSQDIISVRSVSMGMLEDVQQLLTLFGITSRIQVGSSDPRGYAPRHILRIAGRRSNAIFYDRIGFLGTKKHLLCAVSGRMYEEPHTSHNSADLITLVPDFDMSTIKPALHAAVRAEEGYVPQALHVLTSRLTRGRTKSLTSARASWILSHLPNDLEAAEVDFLREAVDGTYLECKIISIEHGPLVSMYDIAVDNLAQYIAHGIIVHNSTEPNLQNIPVRTQEGREIRRGFVAAPGHTFIAADYSQIELRVLAYITRDPSLVRAFQEGQDIHTATAAQLFGLPIEQVDKNQRRIAKSVVFGVIYGMSAFGLAQRTELSRTDAQALIDGLFTRFPGIRAYISETLERGQANGYVSTIFGRRREMRDLQTKGPRRAAAEREAVNAPIQGTAADIMKIAMVKLSRAIDEGGLRTRMLLQVHDELILEAPDDEVQIAKDLVRAVMEHAYELTWTDENGAEQHVPLGVDVETGPNWEEMA
jgi:DNA polymerase I